MGVFDRFMRIGNHIINTAMISHVDLQATRWRSKGDFGVDLTMISINNDGGTQSDVLQFDGDQADALRWIFSPPANEHLGDMTDLYREVRDLQQAIAAEDTDDAE